MKTFILVFCLLLSSCSKTIESYEEADAEIPRLIAQYREAVFAGNSKRARELHSETHDLISRWGITNSLCTVRAFQRLSQSAMLYAIPMEYVLHRKTQLSAGEQERALHDYYGYLSNSDVGPERLSGSIDSCTRGGDRFTPAELAAIHAASKPVHDIDRAVTAGYSAQVRASAVASYERDAAEGQALLRARESAGKEVADCVTAATADPAVTTQVTANEIKAACTTMLK